MAMRQIFISHGPGTANGAEPQAMSRRVGP